MHRDRWGSDSLLWKMQIHPAGELKNQMVIWQKCGDFLLYSKSRGLFYYITMFLSLNKLCWFHWQSHGYELVTPRKISKGRLQWVPLIRSNRCTFSNICICVITFFLHVFQGAAGRRRHVQVFGHRLGVWGIRASSVAVLCVVLVQVWCIPQRLLEICWTHLQCGYSRQRGFCPQVHPVSSLSMPRR